MMLKCTNYERLIEGQGTISGLYCVNVIYFNIYNSCVYKVTVTYFYFKGRLI